MITIQLVIFISLITTFISLGYKIYTQDTLNDISNSEALFGLFRRIFTVKYLFPINGANYNEKQRKTIRSANRALLVFWISFSLLIIACAILAYMQSA